VTGEPLSTEEILSMLTLLLVAGIETTTNLITSTIRFVAEHPEHWAWIREDPGPRAEQFVEEALRYFSPVKALPRITRVDATLGEVAIPAGSVLFLVYAAANRDDEQYAEPHAFDLTRPNPRQHLAFGHGKHFCLGAPLARLETQVTLRRATERFEPPVLSSENTYRPRPGWLLPGLDELLVQLTPRSTLSTSY
jgi:cytochrome P450